MNLACRGAVALAGLGVALTFGCGKSSPRAETYPSEVKIDAGSTDAGRDAGGDDGAAGDAAPLPPQAGAGSMRIVAGPVVLLGNGPPCTHADGATGDRWCAFRTPSQVIFGGETLFVVNVSRAAAGTPITCGGPAGDPNCLPLTEGFGEDSTHRAQFQGDTLVYFDVTATPYGWRPGMLNGRRLATASASLGEVHDCVPASVGTAVMCLRDRPAPADAPPSPDTVTYSDLLVGRVSATSPPLQVVDTLISFEGADVTQRFRSAIVTPLGDDVAWSARSVPRGPEFLKVQKIGDATTRRTVAMGVTRWGISADASHWLWLDGFDDAALSPSGTLQFAPYPDGTSPVTLMPDVTSAFFAPYGNGVITETGQQLLGSIPDPIGAPTTVVTLDSGVIGVVAASRQGYLGYVKNFDFLFELVDFFVKKFDGSGPTCLLDSQMEVPFNNVLGPVFLRGGGGLLWTRVTNLDAPLGTLIFDARFTHLPDCRTTTVATDVSSQDAAGDDGVLITDGYDGQSATLRLRNLIDGSMLDPGAAVVVQTRMNTSLPLYPLPGAVLYTVNVGDPNDGLYIRQIAGAGVPPR